MVSKNYNLLEKVISLCKRRGFIYQSNDIYGGINGVWDKGPLGAILSRNIENYWFSWMKINSKYPLLPFDGAILGGEKLWTASGHITNFKDPLIECLSCHTRVKFDELKEKLSNCERCGKNNWSEKRDFHMMFKSQLGAMEESSSTCYLRPETAQSIFSQFKNIMTTNRVKIPFGIIQIGKAFRNEINPKQFLFRSREFSQMEMEFFCEEQERDHFFTLWTELRYKFLLSLGFSEERIKIHKQTKEELAHYSKQTNDIEYHFPFGWKEIEGVADRGSFDLLNHEQHSQKKMIYHDSVKDIFYLPSVIESSIGIERLMLALFCEGYREEEEEKGTRIVLVLPFVLAPIQIALFPLSKNEEEYTVKIKNILEKYFRVEYDNSGSIGKRYRRQDEIGTPFCVTIDKETLETGIITIREQKSKKQTSIHKDTILSFFIDYNNKQS